MIKSVLYQQIVVVGNKVQFTRLQATLDDIACQLEQIEAASELDSELLLPIRTAVEIISNAFTESSESISLVVADEKTMKCEPKTTNNKTNRLNVLKESAGN
ncbi:MAG: hypothetical protein FWG24_06685 [Eggerthellaceae bacterium]|nr:hypothetical protein [Eggerthellaceae bacterium]